MDIIYSEVPSHFPSAHDLILLLQTPRYLWDPETQGWLLGGFFFGYLGTQMLGGYLSGHYGGSIFLGVGVLGTSILTLLTPLAAQLGPTWLFALRALEGFGEVKVQINIHFIGECVFNDDVIFQATEDSQTHTTCVYFLIEGPHFPSYDGDVDSVGPSPGAFPFNDFFRIWVQLWGFCGSSADRLHLPNLRLARRLLHLW